MSVAAASLKRTPLYECHVEAGARMVSFAGFEMPVSYQGVRQEHVAVRTAAGLFDVSHMGEVATRGPRAAEFLRHLLTNDIGRVAPGGSQYALLCREDGGMLDDLFTYRLSEDSFLTVVNAANAESDLAWFAKQAASWDGVEVADCRADYAMLAFQGPRAVSMLEPLLDEGAVPPRFGHVNCVIEGAEALVCRTGYTGEDGVELLCAPDDGAAVWRTLIEAGAIPAGLGARDTLRIEVCYPLYSNDLSVERTPIEAGLGWACALDKDFVGAGRLREQAERGTVERLMPFAFTGPGIPRQGCAVVARGERAGVVTSGTLSPCLEIGVGLAYVAAELAEPGTEIEIDVRGKLRAARVEKKPLYRT